MSYFILILSGVLASCFALILEIILLPSGFSLSQSISLTLFTALVLASLALIEEGAKYLFLRQYIRRFSDQSGTTGLFFLSLLFGASFSLLELGLSLQNALPWLLLPMLGRTLLHIVTSYTLLSFIVRPFPTALFKKIVLPILVATLIHFVYNIAFLIGH
jgi:RsiW-degrading membrane proteinase PrsW (M82 family)